MNKLEELFNERLANHSIPPPPAGWERVATNLSKKNNKVAWIGWAAVLLIGVIAIGLTATRQSTPVEVMSQNNSPKENTSETPRESVVAKQNEPLATVSSPQKRNRKIIKKASVTTALTSTALVTAEVQPQSQPSEKLSEEINTIAEAPTIEPIQESKVATRSIVITYTLDPVIPVSPAVEEAPKSSSLGKVVKFARNVKNGDSPLGLKIVKEDLFAHSKKKSPTKTH